MVYQNAKIPQTAGIFFCKKAAMGSNPKGASVKRDGPAEPSSKARSKTIERGAAGRQAAKRVE